MHGLVTNYFSATHDKQLLMIFYAKCLLTTNIVKAQHVFNHVKKDISFYINWEEKVLLPLFEDRNSPLFETYPTYSLQLEFQHCRILTEHIYKAFEQILLLIQSNYEGAQMNVKQQVTDLITFFDELESLLKAINIKSESIFFPTIDETLKQEDIADLFLTLAHYAAAK